MGTKTSIQAQRQSTQFYLPQGRTIRACLKQAVELDGKELGRGQGNSKKAAEIAGRETGAGQPGLICLAINVSLATNLKFDVQTCKSFVIRVRSGLP